MSGLPPLTARFICGTEGIAGRAVVMPSSRVPVTAHPNQPSTSCPLLAGLPHSFMQHPGPAAACAAQLPPEPPCTATAAPVAAAHIPAACYNPQCTAAHLHLQLHAQPLQPLRVLAALRVRGPCSRRAIDPKSQESTDQLSCTRAALQPPHMCQQSCSSPSECMHAAQAHPCCSNMDAAARARWQNQRSPVTSTSILSPSSSPSPSSCTPSSSAGQNHTESRGQEGL